MMSIDHKHKQDEMNARWAAKRGERERGEGRGKVTNREIPPCT